MALSIDWTDRFDGREAQPDTWEHRLLPALEVVAVAQACERHTPGRRVVAEGLYALPAAIALGTTFLAPRRLSIEWAPFHPNRGTQIWGLGATREASGFTGEIRSADNTADDLAVLVSVASDVIPAFGASRPSLPKFRGLVVVQRPGTYPHHIETPGQAIDLVRGHAPNLQTGARRAAAGTDRNRWMVPRGCDTVHLENGLGEIKANRNDGHGSGSPCSCLRRTHAPTSGRRTGAVHAIKWAVQRARYMSLETIALLSDDPFVRLPVVAA
jgi:hypothetical protein